MINFDTIPWYDIKNDCYYFRSVRDIDSSLDKSCVFETINKDSSIPNPTTCKGCPCYINNEDAGKLYGDDTTSFNDGTLLEEDLDDINTHCVFCSIENTGYDFNCSHSCRKSCKDCPDVMNKEEADKIVTDIIISRIKE